MKKTYIKPVIVGFVVAFATSGILALIGAAGGADPGYTPALVGMIFGAAAAYVMANLAGNRKGRAASDAEKSAAIEFSPPAGMALLLVVREGFVGKAAGMNVRVDGVTVTQLKAPRFAAVPLEAGEHELELAFGGLAGDQNRAGVERFRVEVGDVHVYRARISMGALKNTITAERIPADQGLAAKLRSMSMTALAG